MYKPRDYQANAVRSIFNYFNNGGQGNPLVCLPTGSGKALIIAFFIPEALTAYPQTRIMMLTHVKELIEQNAEKVNVVWPALPVGIHSAGLNKRDTQTPVIFGGVQSVANTIKKKPNAFGYRDLLIVDEAHLINSKADSQYGEVIAALRETNPYLKIIGLTATPYRLKDGRLTDPGGMFTDIVFDLTNVEGFNRLMAEGYLCPLIPKRTSIQIDTSKVKVTAGEFNQKALQEATDKERITYAAIKEALELGHDRKSWMVFASGIEHTEHVCAMLQSFGVEATFVHSKVKPEDRRERLEAFKRGEYRAIVGFRVLTTGFDHPPIDLILDLYPTMSPGMHVQKYGRGMRPSPDTGKQNCLVLDFAKNTLRLGPVNDPVLPRKAGKGGGEAPVRICDECGVYNHASARNCICCGKEFTFQTKIFAEAGTEELIKDETPVIEYLDVTKVFYTLHKKKSSPDSIKVTYVCGLSQFTEYVCIEHAGYAGDKARDWWRMRHTEEAPFTTKEALDRTKQLRTPKQIKVWSNKRYPEILGVEW